MEYLFRLTSWTFLGRFLWSLALVTWHSSKPMTKPSKKVWFNLENNWCVKPGLVSWLLCKPRTFSWEPASLSKPLLGFGILPILTKMVGIMAMQCIVCIWRSNVNQAWPKLFTGKLNTEEFCVAMHLCEQFQKGEPLPPQLPVRFTFGLLCIIHGFQRALS